MKNSVLLIDDDVELTVMLKSYLAREGFLVTVVHRGEQGAELAIGGDYAVVVLDVMMPGFSGIETLRRIRAQSDIGVLLLTARGDDLDRIQGLDLGADDYVPKPCSPGELVARIRAILRRTNQVDKLVVLRSGHLELFPGLRQVRWQGRALELTGTEFNLLHVLAKNAGQLISKNDLSMGAFNRPLTRYDRRIDVHLSSIRQKLGLRDDGTSWILGVRGQGYQLIQDCRL